MSIDLYPALDVGEIDVAVALERRVEAGSVAPLGAASLLERNDGARYPEFAGRDLRTRWPEIETRNLAMDGATIGDVFGMQLSRIEEREDEVLATLTVGGNDLLSAFSTQPRASLTSTASGGAAASALARAFTQASAARRFSSASAGTCGSN